MAHAEAAPGARPRLLVRLAKGWQLDPAQGLLGPGRTPAGNRFPSLPGGTEISPLIPALSLRGGRRTPAERELASTVQVLLPADADTASWLAVLLDSDAVESAQIAPKIALPGV